MPLLTKNLQKDGIKLAPPIRQLSVLSYEKHADQKLWYIIKVTPQQTDSLLQSSQPSNNDTRRHSLKRKSYLIARRFDQFCTLDQQLHSCFSTSIFSSIRLRRLTHPTSTHVSKSSTSNSVDTYDIPKLKLQRKILPNKSIHSERQCELHRYCQELLKLPPYITHSLLMLEFFGLHKADTERIVYSSMACLSASRLSHVSSSSFTRPTTPIQNHSTESSNPSSPTLIVSRRARSIVQDDDALHRSVKKAKSQPNFRPSSLLPPSPPTLPSLLVAYDDINCRSSPYPFYSSSSTIWLTPLSPENTPPPSPLGPINNNNKIVSPGAPTHGSSTFGNTGETVYEAFQPYYGFNNRSGDSLQSSDKTGTNDDDDDHNDKNDNNNNNNSDIELMNSNFTTTTTTSIPTEHSFFSSMTLASTATSSSPLKLKVVYDLDNIIMLQVPRNIRLPELRARILHKFEDIAMDLPVDFKLVFNSIGGRKDSLLSLSAAYSTYADLDARAIIGTQDDLMNALSQWTQLSKVSVRCVVH